MEGFPLDVQRIILKEVCSNDLNIYLIGNVFPLLQVNHMFRRWALRFVLDTVDKEWLLEQLAIFLSWTKEDMNKWDIYKTLLNQWSPIRMVSFIIFMSFEKCPVLSRYISYNKVYSIFFTKDSLLYDLRKKRGQLERVSQENKYIRYCQQTLIDNKKEKKRLKRILEEHVEKKEAEESIIEILDKKYKVL